MAEPLSLAASIAALGGLLVTVARFAHEMSGYYEDLLRYYMTLEIIQRTTSMILYISAKSESARSIEFTIKGRKESIIHFCARSVESLASDVRRLTATLKTAYDKRSREAGATRSHMRRLTGALTRTPSKFQFALNHRHIKDLIQGAKLIESSLYFAQSTLLLSWNEARTIETQELLSSLQNSFREFTERRNPAVIYINEQSESQLEQSAGGAESNRLQIQRGTYSLLRTHSLLRTISPQSTQRAESMLEEHVSETLASIRYDGRLQESQHIGRFLGSTHRILTEVEGADKLSSYTPCPSRDNVMRDESELGLDPNAEVFIDGSVQLADCVSLENSDCLEFCTRTMIVHNTEPTVLVLKERCNSTPCSHISVCVHGSLSSELQTPCYYQVILQEQRNPEYPLDTRSSDTEYISLFATQHSDASSSMQCGHLLSPLSRPPEEEDQKSEHSEASPECILNIEDVQEEQEEERSVQSEELALAGILPYSSLQCCFCRQDALRPRLSAEGIQALLLLKNRSFGYTCERCKDRTWVSAISYDGNRCVLEVLVTPTLV
ncbi:hypothetical protein BDW60DRAFT_223692 [Aspergillus nidulans var. acristatus]